ncbi:MAG TPA: RES family NAD+ phosphorylase [Longimicrobium sp.]|nr:RES family NAD+ phosphorylase [Longimicrobium sp.]
MTAPPAPLPTVVVPARTVFWRIHPRGRDALWFGPDPSSGPLNRFDAPAREYGVCYLGDSLEVAVAETLIRVPGPARVVARARLHERSASQLVLREPLRVVQLEGPGLVRLGASADLVHAFPYGACQRMALEFWSHPDAVDGIQYRSRWDNSRLCWALFDRARDKLGAPLGTLWLGDPNVVVPVLDHYDIGVV